MRMASIRPFRALRPAPAQAAAVSSVPYDVVSTEEARQLAAGNPLSFLHVTRSEIDLPPGTDPYDAAVYERARRNFADLRSRAPLELDDTPGLYFYRLRMGVHEQTGITACFSLDEYASDVIKKHERTRRDKEDDRTRHIIELRAQTGVVFLTYRSVPSIDRVTREVTAGEPLYDFTADDGVRHTIWRTGPAQTATLVDVFKTVPALYIADGHHRAASAARARAEVAGAPGATGDEADASTFIAVAFPDNQVDILPYNRTVKDLGGRTPEQFLEEIRTRVPVTPGVPTPNRQGDVSMYVAGRWHTLALSGAKPADDSRASALDVARAAAHRARAGARHRRRAHRQAHRIRRRRPRDEGAPGNRRQREGGGRVLDVPRDHRRLDDHLGRRRHHAAQIDVVRAQAARRLVDSPDMKVLVADKFEQSGIAGLKAAGCDVIFQPELKDDALSDAIRSSAADVLVVRGTAVTAAMLDAGRLSLVVRAGAGYNTIDVAAASKRGIYVSNCPGKNAIAVAELAFALILALDRRVPDNVADLRAGVWNKTEYSKAAGLYGRTLGLLGSGNIGREMIRRAASFGMHVVLWSRRVAGEDRLMNESEARELGVESAWRTIPVAIAPSPAEVAARVDVLSVHLALSPETRNLVNREVLDRLRDGAFFINTARGEIVDHAALAEAARTKHLRIGLDVFANEPSGEAAGSTTSC